ncbi:MAG: T9SS type A sorting domain-containing protein [Ignavibacteriaceae bacterium]|nr:T9SS type A sorting domain-containing protein [Ignavibacteriaceae bacterium]
MNKKSFFFLIVMAFVVNTSFAQILVENFNYPAGDSLTGHGWSRHSGTSGTILVGTPGLEFPNYIVTGGNNALLYQNGEDINKTFDSLTAGSVYTSMLVKLTANIPAAGYFFHYGRNPFNTFDFRARTWLKPDGAGYRIGLSPSGNADTVFTTEVFNVDSTYLFVIKYTVVDAASDSISMWIFKPGDNFATEVAPTIGPLSMAAADISPGSIAFRQFNTDQRIIVDNIQVSNSWLLNVVPVEFVSFSATSQNGKVDLAWQTASETNNKGFEVERSLDNKNFTVVGYVDGRGTTTQTSVYNFSDKFDVNGTVYYRLKQIDFDGTTAFSNTIEVESNLITGFEMFQNYPNPFNPSTTIKFTVAETGMASLKVFNVTGELVANLFNQTVEKGTVYTVNFDASKLNSGVYFAQLSQGSNVKNIKLILNK